MYLASLNDFYTFILDMFLPPRPAYAALRWLPRSVVVRREARTTER